MLTPKPDDFTNLDNVDIQFWIIVCGIHADETASNRIEGEAA